MSRLAPLPTRAVLEVTGEDRVSFLQGLVSGDVTEVAPGRAVWAALLTPQGKWLADFFLLSDGTRLLLDCEAAQAGGLATRLLRFRLRARAAVAPTALLVHVAWDGTPEVPEDVVAAPDPRLPEAGWRLLSPRQLVANATAADWDRHRLPLGLPDGSSDLEAERSVLLEAGFDELGGVSWSKGCFMGQELTARTRYRGLVKRRLVPVRAEGVLPAPGTAVWRDGVEVGTMRSGRDGMGLAMLRLGVLEGTPNGYSSGPKEAGSGLAAGGPDGGAEGRGGATGSTPPAGLPDASPGGAPDAEQGVLPTATGELRCGEAVLHPMPPAWMRPSRS